MKEITFPRGREIVLGIGAGIAAYKSCDLLRRLQDHGFLVTVIPTPSSLHFVGKATWEALSGRTVNTDVWENIPAVPHVALGAKADFLIIAPATADLIARIAVGRADDLLTNTVLTTLAPIILVPAMHPQMWQNQATVANVALLRARGIHVLEPAVGRLTGNDIGVGRFPETSEIIAKFLEISQSNCDLLGKKILITAGGTREAIDPVRYIGNRSSGKQGYALAFAAAKRGAIVELIAANSAIPDIEGITTIHVESADELDLVVQDRFPDNDALLMCAAVADAKPNQYSDSKIKKSALSQIELTTNPDILANIAKKRRSNQVLLGFAAETDSDLLTSGKAKLLAKGVDFLYVNQVSQGAIFGSDLTSGYILDREGSVAKVEAVSKDTLSEILLDSVVERLRYANV
ncbi:MAG: bifunctional phosphopantothenoylcysteine decarboxylase/phosphopantothenate--cysteine ligase CoaBC [Actinobacteria bacterium]|nr:bifunctional phosphopantothenoylcysteine decarboxylase/phosphopantothenate--cysteine ligase CoaBC [Actinomycetota bacterium]NDH12343.1 bifunctional phosphopantothenoylcysteine decarboxylase/phosphopantothenate--cysteine ligase CoaBC [Actinomycetota bacterium]